VAGDTPSRKRRFRRSRPPEAAEGGIPPAPGPEDAADRPALLSRAAGHDDERGPTASLAVTDGAFGAEHAGATAPFGDVPETGPQTPHTGRLGAVGRGVRRGGESARVALGLLADRIIDLAPRIPVRDLETLRRQFPGLGPEELADKLVSGATAGSATVGAGVGAAAMLPVPPALPAELAAEITAVAAIELKLIAELHEVYGRRPPGNLKERAVAYLTSWTTERGVDLSKPATVSGALGGPVKRELRQQIVKRTVRSLPNLVPFMVGAAVGAFMNRRDTRHVADHVRKDLRRRQVPWEVLDARPPLEGLPGGNPPELPGPGD
jgi:hypothetical protein